MSILERMKNKAQLQPANLFFIELMCVLLFFALSAAIILRVFVAADNKQKLGSLTERSIICAQSLAESYSVTGDISEAVMLVFGAEVDDTKGSVTVDLDSNMTISDNEVVMLQLTEISNAVDDAGRLSRMQMDFTTGETKLFSLCCSAYIPKMGGAADE